MRKKILAILVMAAMITSLAGCKKDDDTNNTTNATTTVHGQVTEAPEGFVDNTENKYALTNEELYMTISDIDRMAMRDDTVFADGDGFQFRFTTNLLCTDPTVTPETNSDAISVAAIKDHVTEIKIADKTYKIDDLCRDNLSGIDVLKMFSKDFGVNVYTDEMTKVEHKGDITDEEALRSAYSERVEYEDYTVCAYYFDAKMNNLDDKTYDKYREAYNAKYNIDTSESLDGTLAVMMYYDISGHDYFYAIAISAPTYWDSEENFNANMNVNVRKDITNCHMKFDNNTSVGFVNGMVITCTE